MRFFPFRPARTIMIVLAGLTACAPVDSPPEMSSSKEWNDLIGRTRVPILKDSKDADPDLLGWQKLLDERVQAEQERLSKQPKVTAAFVDLGIRDALFEISTQTKVPIVVDQSVNGNVTLDLKNTPLESALRLVVFAGNYAYSTDGFAYYVGIVDPAGPNYSTLTTTRMIPTYMPPKQLVAGMNKAYAQYLSFAEGSNKLTLTGPSSVLDRLEAEIRLFDRPSPQVMIEVLVVETKYGDEFDLGLEYSKLEGSVTKSKMTDNDPSTVNLSQMDAIGRISWAFNALEAKQLALIRSHPKVVTTSGTPAEIRSQVENYVLITRPGVTFFQTNLEIIKAGTVLKVTPLVTRNDEIELTLEPEVSDVVGITSDSSGSLPVISRRGIKSTVRLKSNDVLVIGGLYSESVRSKLSGLPFLKDVPVVNLVAGKQSRAGITSELLIFVSPKVVK